MRLPVLCIGFVMLTASCGDGGPTDGRPAGQDVAAACDFMDEVPGAVATTEEEPQELTQANIDAAVRVAPAEVAGDLRIVLEAALTFQQVVGDTQGLAPEEIAERASEAAQVTQTDEYMEAVSSLGSYLREHCPELADGF